MKRKYYLKKDSLKQLCAENHIKFGELAELLNLNQGVFSYRLNNIRACSEEEVLNLASIFNVPLCEICYFYCNVSDQEIEETIALMKGKVFNKERFKSLLKENGITKKFFANILNCSENSIDRWCGHYGNPKPHVAVRISKYFDVPLSTLFDYGDIISYGTKEPLHSNPDKAESALEEPVENSNLGEKETLSDVENIAEDNSSVEPFELNMQVFDEGNVLDNLRIINENLIAFSSFVTTEMKTLSHELASVQSRMDSIDEVLAELKGKVDTLQNETDKTPKASVILPQSLSDNEVLCICKDSCREDNYFSYKDKVQKLLAFIGKRSNLVYNQVARNFYLEFEKVYGMSLNSMKKGYSKDTNTLKIIYDDPATREIFFNIVATEASHLAGDQIRLH